LIPYRYHIGPAIETISLTTEENVIVDIDIFWDPTLMVPKVDTSFSWASILNS
jgi:hypothetical protein